MAQKALTVLCLMVSWASSGCGDAAGVLSPPDGGPDRVDDGGDGVDDGGGGVEPACRDGRRAIGSCEEAFLLGNGWPCYFGTTCERSTAPCCVQRVACLPVTACPGLNVTSSRVDCSEGCVACPGVAERGEPAEPCHGEGDCRPGRACLPPGEPWCGGACYDDDCATTADCAEGLACTTVRDPCACDSGMLRSCEPDCRDRPCEDGSICDGASGVCQPVPCEAGYACPVNTVCGSVGGEPVDPALSDEHGCVRRSCTDDPECECGACVNGHCYDGLGTCVTPAL